MRSKVLSVAVLTFALIGGSTFAFAEVSEAAGEWTEVQVQTISGQDSYFNDVTVTPSGTVWAVGYRIAWLPGAYEFRTNIQRSVGGSFQMVTSPDVEGP